MKINIKETIKLCAVFLQLENVLGLNVISGENETMADEEKAAAEKELKLLLRCVNLVNGEVASEYFHLKTCEVFDTKDGKIKYTDFKKQPVDIYGVKKGGEPCAFKLYPSEIIACPGKIEVYYTYLPDKAELDGSFDYEEGKMNSRILAYGAAAEYCIISGMYEEALIWDKRYKDSLFCAQRSLKAVNIPARRWV